ERDLTRQFARLDDLDVTYGLSDHAALLKHLNVDVVNRQALQIGQAHLGVQMLSQACKTALGQTTLQRHLTTFKADFMKAARTRFLAFMTTTTGLAQAG